MQFREELAKLETSGLKNRNHTLTLSRLMVRAESWDDRERLLKILSNGEAPCRRLFLDYHGLRLIWSWMFDLPLPHESDGPQLIRNDVYHILVRIFVASLSCTFSKIFGHKIITNIFMIIVSSSSSIASDSQQNASSRQ